MGTSLGETLTDLFDGYVEGMLSNAIKAYEYNQRYPSVTSLNYVRVPEEKANELMEYMNKDVKQAD